MSARLRASGCGPAAHGGHLADLPCAEQPLPACRALAASKTFLPTLVMVTALGPLAMSSFVPAIPAIQRDFDVSGTVAQLTLTVSIVTMAFASLAYGTLADRFGRRSVLLAGIGIGALGSVVCALSPTIGAVIAGRALQAAGASTGFVLARVIVRDVYGDDRSATVLAYVTAAMTVAPMAGPLLGGYLIDNVSWRAVFVSVAVVASALFVIVALRLPETRPAVSVDALGVPGNGYRRVLSNPHYLKYLAYGTMSQAAFFGFIAGAPYIMSEILGYPATVYGAWFTAVPLGYFVGSLLAARLGRRLSHERATVIGAWMGLIACIIGWFWTAGVAFAPAALFLPAAVLAIGSGIALPGAQAGLLAAAGRHAGAGSGLFSFTQLIASALLAQLVGILQWMGSGGLFGIMVVASALALAGFVIIDHTSRRSARAG